MHLDADVLIRVHDSWSGWQSAEVRLTDLGDVHWLRPSGAPHQLIHAFVSCAHVSSAGLPHVCDRVTMPHRVLVCVLKRHTTAMIYGELARRADASSPVALARTPGVTRPAGALNVQG